MPAAIRRGSPLTTSSITLALISEGWRLPSKLALLGGEPLRKRPFAKWPVFDERERAQLEDVLRSGSWGGHPSPNRKATEFATRFADFQGGKHVIPTSSGTSALEVALKALEIGPGDEVIVPAITFAATAYAPVACNARPVFADVDTETICIDPESVRAMITPRTRAIIPVHYGASLADLDALTEIARPRSIAIIEDCAHVPGAKWRDRGVGTWGAMGCFSFQSSKPMTAGEGGAITVSDADLEQKCQSLINCGRHRPGDTFESPLMGANYRMTEWQCGILLAQIERAEEQMKLKSAMATRLRAGLNAIAGIHAIARDPRVTREVICAFIFKIDERELRISRNTFVKAMRAEGVPCGVGNDPVYRSSLFPRESRAYRTAYELAGLKPGSEEISCAAAEHLFEHEMAALPHECLLGGDADVDDIIAAANKVAENAKALAASKSARA
jgi:dTDP-4-amino-4,6-dideoxygalactose transaminase